MKNNLFTKIVLAFLVIIVVIGFAVWLNYGTIHPCGILKKEVSRIMDLDIFLGYPIMNASVDRLSPIQCINQVIMIKISSEEEAKEMIDKFIFSF